MCAALPDEMDCRRYSGKKLIRDKYVLSLKDLNLSSYIDDLIEAGVDSFKIEGRLKDEIMWRMLRIIILR